MPTLIVHGLVFKISDSRSIVPVPRMRRFSEIRNFALA
jgi:hypothetical protein